MRLRCWQRIGFVLVAWLSFSGSWPATAADLDLAVRVLRKDQPVSEDLIRGGIAQRDGYFVPPAVLEEMLRQHAELWKVLQTSRLEVDAKDAECLVRLSTAEALGKIAVEKAEKLRDLEVAEYVKRNTALTTENEALRNPPFYKAPWFYGALGLILGAVLH